MPTVNCPHKGCQKSFSHDTTKLAAQALRMHEGRVHSKSIPDPSHHRRTPDPLTSPARHNGNGHVVEFVAQPKRPCTDRRSKAWKAANPDKVGEVAAKRKGKKLIPVQHACFCPRCGLNLQMLDAAMQVSINYTYA